MYGHVGRAMQPSALVDGGVSADEASPTWAIVLVALSGWT